MFNIALFEPEIAPNTGNIMRLAANTGCALHLIHPLGFAFDDKRLRRAGMDYRDIANVRHHDDLTAFSLWCSQRQIFAYSTRGKQRYDQAAIKADAVLLFGPETRGLPDDWLVTVPATQRLFLPMAANSRSLNLANSVAVAVYDAWRRNGFAV